MNEQTTFIIAVFVALLISGTIQALRQRNFPKEIASKLKSEGATSIEITKSQKYLTDRFDLFEVGFVDCRGQQQAQQVLVRYLIDFGPEVIWDFVGDPCRDRLSQQLSIDELQTKLAEQMKLLRAEGLS